MTENFHDLVESTASDLRATAKDVHVNTLITILYVSDVINTTVDKWLKKYGVNQTMLAIIYLLVINGGTMGPTLLSNKIFRTKQAITLAVDNLSKAGLVTRAPIGSDRRTRRVRITRKGLRLAQRTLALRQELVFSTMSSLDREEMAKIDSILRKLGNKLREQIDKSKN